MAQHDATKITNKPLLHCSAHKKKNEQKIGKPEHIAHLQFDENSEAKLENCTKPFRGWGENFNLSFYSS
jgi:hypothetical protein